MEVYVNESSQFHTAQTKHLMKKIVNDNERFIITFVNCVILCGVVSFLGTLANLINLVVFYRHGLNTTINISFFALGIADLCTLLILQWYVLNVNPLFQKCGLPIVYNEFRYMTGSIPRAVFTRISCQITVYITAERCLCIAFPLHVKQMITSRRTTAVMVLIYGFSCMAPLPFYSATYLGWRFYPETNKTLLGIIYTKYSVKVEGVVYMIHGVCEFLSFVMVVVFTLILIQKLNYKRTWREIANVGQGKSASSFSRDRATMGMIVLIASIFIICYTPGVLFSATTYIEPEFGFTGGYYNLYFSLWSFGLLLESINSSVNIFIYLKMSTKYRNTFKQFFFKCQKTSFIKQSTK